MAAPASGTHLAWAAVPSGIGAATTDTRRAGVGEPLYWRACGLFDDDNKVVKLFAINQSRDAVFYCGHDVQGDSYGYRHMLVNKDRWERLTPGTDQSWREIADLAMTTAAATPLHRVPVGGAQQCRDATIYLVNKRDGSVVRTVDVVMYVSVDGWRINTVIPGKWC